MSILHRTAYLTLSALLAIVPAACGGDDDDDTADDTDDTSDDTSDDTGDAPDAGDETPDAGTPDAGDETPDAAVLEGTQYLMGVDITAEVGATLEATSRIIATVSIDEETGTATFLLQPIWATGCANPPDGAGEPVGEPRLVEDVTINKDLTFELVLEGTEFPAGSVDNPAACGLPVTADLTISGSIAGGAPCGTIEGEITPPTVVTGPLTGTFGAVEIETGTTGDENLPEAVLECPAALR